MKDNNTFREIGEKLLCVFIPNQAVYRIEGAKPILQLWQLSMGFGPVQTIWRHPSPEAIAGVSQLVIAALTDGLVALAFRNIGARVLHYKEIIKQGFLGTQHDVGLRVYLSRRSVCV